MVVERGLRVDSLTVVLNGRPVIVDASFTAARGELTVVLGPNGSGKTTLLKTLAGIYTPVKGRALLDGIDLTRASIKLRARLVGYMPAEGVEVGLGQRVVEFVAASRYPLHRGLSPTIKSLDVKEAIKALKAVEAEHLAPRPLLKTSSGEKQRALLAHNLAKNPPLLLADEPTSFLDLAGRLRTYNILKDLAREGKVVLVATHDMLLAGLYADKIVLMESGRIVYTGSIEGAYDKGVLERVFRVRVEMISVRGLSRRVPLPLEPI